jgi:hypothetical protein
MRRYYSSYGYYGRYYPRRRYYRYWDDYYDYDWYYYRRQYYPYDYYLY